MTDPNDETYTVLHKIVVDKIGVSKDKNHTDTIELDAGTIIKMKYPGIDFFVEGVSLGNIADRLDLAAKCIQSIVIGEEVYNAEDMAEGEAQEWLEGLTSVQFNKVMDFFLTMPRLEHSFTLKNKNTGKNFTIKLEGLQDFF